MCERDRLLFRCIVPLICVYAVEWHLPQRVATQFGVLQHTPPARPHDTGCYDLHKYVLPSLYRDFFKFDVLMVFCVFACYVPMQEEQAVFSVDIGLG